MEPFIYLLKVTSCTAAFFVVYYLWLQKLTFFSLNRWYLLSSLMFSVVVPLVHIGVQTAVPLADFKPIIISAAARTVTETPYPVTLRQPTSNINWLQIATYLYLAIAALLIIKLLVALGGIGYKALKYGERQNGYYLVNQLKRSNSSFFRYIFLNSAGISASEKEQVIAHELVHVQKLHWADNLFIEVLKASLWFNPFVYLFGKALCQAHEFEVDHCLANRYNAKSYAALLLKLSAPANISLVNQFSAYGLKSRIGMLFSKPSAAAKKLSYLLILPVTVALVYFLSVDKVYAYTKGAPVSNFVLVLDAGHRGKTGGVAPNGVTEEDLALTMVKQIKAVAEMRGIKTILTRSDNRFVSFDDRLIPQGDIFVSVHFNSVSSPGKYSELNGIAVITDRINQKQSADLATVFKKSMQQLSGITTDTILRRQGIKLLRDNKKPAILIELGYLTNKSDLEYITNKDNQHDMAEKFVDAVIAYKTQYVLK